LSESISDIKYQALKEGHLKEGQDFVCWMAKKHPGLWRRMCREYMSYCKSKEKDSGVLSI